MLSNVFLPQVTFVSDNPWKYFHKINDIPMRKQFVMKTPVDRNIYIQSTKWQEPTKWQKPTMWQSSEMIREYGPNQPEILYLTIQNHQNEYTNIPYKCYEFLLAFSSPTQTESADFRAQAWSGEPRALANHSSGFWWCQGKFPLETITTLHDIAGKTSGGFM